MYMVFLSFKDLGIIPNEGTGLENNTSLIQGQQMMEYGRIYSSVTPNLIQTTTSPSLQSIVEAFQGNDSTMASTTNSAATITATETEFNKTLLEYSQTYQELNKELLNKSNKSKTVQKYFNKVVTNDDINYTYVNNYGYTHRYSNDAWNKKDTSCNAPMKISNSDLLLLTEKGPDMGIGQPCNIAGINIKNVSTNEVAWVDTMGSKHIYSADIWNKKNSTCSDPTNITKNVDSIQYNAIPTGSPMMETTPCNKLNANPVLLERLAKINDKLIHYAQIINKEMGNLPVSDNALKETITQHQSKLKTYINNIKTDKTNIERYNNSDYNTLDGQEITSNLVLNSNYLHYMMWIIIAIAILFLFLHATMSDSYNALTVIVGLLAIFLVSRWVYSSM